MLLSHLSRGIIEGTSSVQVKGVLCWKRRWRRRSGGKVCPCQATTMLERHCGAQCCFRGNRQAHKFTKKYGTQKVRNPCCRHSNNKNSREPPQNREVERRSHVGRVWTTFERPWCSNWPPALRCSTVEPKRRRVSHGRLGTLSRVSVFRV